MALEEPCSWPGLTLYDQALALTGPADPGPWPVQAGPAKTSQAWSCFGKAQGELALVMPTLTWPGVAYPWLLPGLALT